MISDLWPEVTTGEQQGPFWSMISQGKITNKWMLSQIFFFLLHLVTSLLKLYLLSIISSVEKHIMPWPHGWVTQGCWPVRILLSSCVGTRRTLMLTERSHSWRHRVLHKKTVQILLIFYTFLYNVSTISTNVQASWFERGIFTESGQMEADNCLW